MPILIARKPETKTAPRLPRLRVLAQSLLDELGVADHELSILLCNDSVIRDLNLRYRKQDKSTDVLAFPAREGSALPQPPTPLLGDIAISLPTANRQANERGVALHVEVSFLLAHGLLHLLGMDHDTPSKAARMNRRTDQLLRAVGIEPPPGARALAAGSRKDTGPATARKRRPTVRRTRPRAHK